MYYPVHIQLPGKTCTGIDYLTVDSESIILTMISNLRRVRHPYKIPLNVQ